jgi:hypothetical protein
MAGGTYRARVLQLEDPGHICVNTEAEQVTVKAHFLIVKAETGAIHEEGEYN